MPGGWKRLPGLRLSGNRVTSPQNGYSSNSRISTQASERTQPLMTKTTEIKEVLDLQHEIRERESIQDVLIAYATAVDTRDWESLDRVFAESARAVYGTDPAFQFVCEGRNEIRTMCEANLGGCGPTQHLLANFRISVDRDRAQSVCSVQAGHFGIDEHVESRYEMWGEYRDDLERYKSGWRIVNRHLHVIHEFGDRGNVLGPG